MYVVFNCLKCNQELEVEKSMVGEQIQCPTCSEVLTIPDGTSTPPAAPSPPPPEAPGEEPATDTTTPVPETPPAAPPPKERHQLSVPMREGPGENLVKKKVIVDPTSTGPKVKKLRIKCIKRILCVEVGHDLFEEKFALAIEKIGEENVVSIHAIGYGYMDTVGHMLPDYGVMIVYKG